MRVPRMIAGAALLLSACALPRADEARVPLPSPLLPIECVVEEGKHLSLRAAGREILRYAIGTVEAPAGVDPVHAAAGFLHPVRTTSGVLVSDSFSSSHPHHHGAWSAWRQGEFEGRNLNGFAPLEKLGRMEFVSLEGVVSGPVCGGFRAKQRLVDLHAPGGPRPAL